MKKVLCIVLTLFMLVGFTGCFSDSNDKDYEFVEKVELYVDYESYLGYTANVKGKLKNTSGKEFLYISVTFAIYDKDGNQIETAIDNMNYLQSGSTWSFDAQMFTWTDVEPYSCKLVDVTAW